MQKHLSVLAVIVTALAFPSIAFAQIEKGKFVAGGEVGYNKRFYPSTETTTQSGFYRDKSDYRIFSSSINLGYMISDRFEIGLFFNYLDNRRTSNSENSFSSQKSKSETKRFGIGPSIRYYQPIIDKLYFFGQLQSGVYTNKDESSSSHYYAGDSSFYWSESKQKYTSLSTNLSPGLSYLPLKWLSFEVLLGGIGWSQIIQSGESPSIDFDFNLNLRSLYIGTRLFF
jgi:hypothetical protein